MNELIFTLLKRDNFKLEIQYLDDSNVWFAEIRHRESGTIAFEISSDSGQGLISGLEKMLNLLGKDNKL